MHLTTLLPLTIWLSATTVTADTAVRVGWWGIYDFMRVSSTDEKICEYTFLIAENASAGRDSAIPCMVDVAAKQKGLDNGTFVNTVPCLQAEFSNAWCGENNRYRVNGGHNVEEKFWVFTINNIVDSHNSFPSYQDWELEPGHVTPERVIASYQTGTFDDGPAANASSVERLVPDKVRRDGPSGTICSATEGTTACVIYNANAGSGLRAPLWSRAVVTLVKGMSSALGMVGW